MVAGQLFWEPTASNGRHQILKWSTFTWIAQLRKIVPPLPHRSNQAQVSLRETQLKTKFQDIWIVTIDEQIWLKWAWVRSTSRKKMFPLWEIWNWSRAEKAIIGCHQSDSKWIFRPGDQGCVRGIVKKREGRKCLKGRKAFSSWPARDWRRRGPLGICLLHQVDLQGFTFFLEPDYGSTI